MASAPSLAAVVARYAEEAAFLWTQRTLAVHAPHYNLLTLDRLDARVEAHLDGLRLTADAGWECCRYLLDQAEPGALFAATATALASRDPARWKHCTERVEMTPEVRDEFASALAWMPFESVQAHLPALARAASPALRRAAIAGWALHRQDPGEALSLALRDPEPGVRARALRAMGELGRRDLLDLGGEAAGSRDDSCQYWSAWASALLVGDEGAVSHLRTFAEASGSHRLRAAALAARRMDPGLAAPWREQLAAHPDGIGAALAAAAACGDPSAVPWLIECMSRFDVARPAGEAFTQITGVDLEDLQMVGSKPEEFESGPTEDPDDENVEMDPDADLPWPDMGKIRAWWDRSSSIFIAGTRYLVGRPIRTAALKEALRTARQRQRGAAAIELAMRDPGSRLFEVRAPGFRQRRALGT